MLSNLFDECNPLREFDTVIFKEFVKASLQIQIDFNCRIQLKVSLASLEIAKILYVELKYDNISPEKCK